MDANEFIQLAINGIVLGSVYALFGMACVFIWRSTGIVSILHGEIIVGSATLVMLLNQEQYVPLQVLISLVVIAVASTAAFLLYHYLLSKQRNILHILLLFFIFKAFFLSVDFVVPNRVSSAKILQLGHTQITVTHQQIIAVILSTAILSLFLLLYYRSQLGRALRAAAEQPLAVRFVGINVVTIQAGAFALGFGLTAASGLLLSSLVYLEPSSVSGWTLKALAVVGLAGVHSIWTAIGAAFIVALYETYSTTILGLDLSYLILLSATVTLLLLRLPELPLSKGYSG